MLRVTAGVGVGFVVGWWACFLMGVLASKTRGSPFADLERGLIDEDDGLRTVEVRS
jgi:hypothetical protein